MYDDELFDEQTEDVDVETEFDEEYDTIIEEQDDLDYFEEEDLQEDDLYNDDFYDDYDV